MLPSLLAGFTFSLALIVAIGAQNAFVLRQGLRREHVLPVVVICAASDAALITIGVAGLGAALAEHRAAVQVVRWVGGVFLLCYAALAARRAVRPGALTPTDGPSIPLGATLLTCLAFTYLNPHVYLDTVLLLGTIAQQHPHRWFFGAGAILASVVWFAALGLGARLLAPVLARPGAWRLLDGAIAVTLTALAVPLLLSKT